MKQFRRWRGATTAALILPLAFGLPLPGNAALPNDPAPLAAVPTPESAFGFRPGEDNKLNSWADVTRYFEKLAATSDRVRVENVGKTTEGRPFLVAVISASENLKNLKKYREINHKLTDPRRLKNGDKEAEDLIRQGKTVVVITCGIHSTEVASYLGGQLIAYRLASATDEETKRILENTIIVLVPSLNPDGVDIVKTWYDKNQNGSAAGAGGAERGGMPLYHKYVGHDDNRDWVGFTQAETRLAVDKAINPWRPQILHDIHQQGSNGPRLFLPPYTDPVEPNIPKKIVEGYTELGKAIAADLTAKGYKGVITGSDSGEGYDAWSPLRQYAHFHNSVRILSETASARIASPITVERVRPDQPLPNFPEPWPAGKWTIGDATNYVTAAAFSLLNHAAVNREKWLRSSYEIAKEAVRPRTAGERAAFLLPPAPNRAPLLSILHRGGVEIEYLTASQRLNDTEYPTGTAVVRLDQPYGGFANAVLSIQKYPDLLDGNGRPIRPYDVTAHTLPLLLNVPVTAVDSPFTVRARATGAPKDEPVRLTAGKPAASVRLGLLKSNSIDEGWTRWVLEQNGVKYTLVDGTELRGGDLRSRFDVILLPTAPGGGGRRGFGVSPAGGESGAPGTGEGAARPARGGQTGAEGTDTQEEGGSGLKAFVEQGGTLIALNRASNAVIVQLGLPIRDVTTSLARNDFYVPGSILRTELDTQNPIARGLDPLSIAWVENSPAFEATEAAQAGQVNVVARYPQNASPLLSGWLLGGEKLQGKAALIEVRIGSGRVILFGFKPNYRGISLATYPLLFNAISTGIEKKAASVSR